VKLFSCTACHTLVFFENVRCTSCGHSLAYLADQTVMSAIEPVPGTDLYVALGSQARYRLCSNSIEHAVCNWAIPEASSETLCDACRCNETIPNLTEAAALDAWHRLESAKRRLFYTLVGLGLPIEPRSAAAPHGLGFAFLQDAADAKVVTGHNDGLITINIAEADAPFREHVRIQMHETYRTLLGHFRHEVGHYYWSRIVESTPVIDAFRERFGDERVDYAERAKQHYEQGPPADWTQHFVSAYASMHPWEDWAETWAHYLHMVDTLETARSYGLALRPVPIGGAPVTQVVARRLHFDDFDDLVTAWVPLTLALNSLNRSMGLPDVYAFVLSDEAIAKLRFVHETIDRR
jgi:hypothetical protein